MSRFVFETEAEKTAAIERALKLKPREPNVVATERGYERTHSKGRRELLVSFRGLKSLLDGEIEVAPVAVVEKTLGDIIELAKETSSVAIPEVVVTVAGDPVVVALPEIVAPIVDDKVIVAIPEVVTPVNTKEEKKVRKSKKDKA